MAGAAAISAGGSRWLVYSTNPTLDTTGGLTPGFIQYNAPAGTSPTPATGSGFLYSVAPTLTVTALSGSVTKTYDGTTSASGTPTFAPALATGDTTTTFSEAYMDRNFGLGNKTLIP